jgi:hypothetical protein
MRKVALAGAFLGAAVAMLPAPSANAALVVYYDFNSLGLGAVPQGTAVPNAGTLASPGVVALGSAAGNQANVVASGIPGGVGGKALQLTPGADSYTNIEPAYIDTGFTAGTLSVTSGTPYTAMAWVNFANANGDNMIFGGNGTIANAGGGQVLHNGTRNGSLHSGHWGDDLGPDQGVAISSQPGTWHHVAYTNEGGTGLQSIYFDGQLVAGPGGSNGTAGGMDNNINLLIGTSNNAGSFSGQLDEIKIFNTLLTQGEIQAAMAVPEPGTLGLVAVGGLMLGRMSRRRRA